MYVLPAEVDIYIDGTLQRTLPVGAYAPADAVEAELLATLAAVGAVGWMNSSTDTTP